MILARVDWLIAFLSGLFAGFLISKFVIQKPSRFLPRRKEVKKSNADTSEEESGSYDSDYKMVLLVRNDLNMGKGKIAAQCSHATLGAFKKAQKKDKRALDGWEEGGQAKVVLRAQNEQEMLDLEEEARKEKLITYLVVDAGKTQVASGTNTVLAIGPGEVSEIDKVTGKLKLL